MEGNLSKSNQDSRSKNAKIDEQVVSDDLVHEILVRLPVKSLVRFKLVSKCWYEVITSPIFIENQLKCRSKTSRMLMVMGKESDDYALSFYELDSLQQVSPVLPIYSYMNIPKSLKFVRCLGGVWSKGILCIMYNKSIRLCNPATRESKLLPPRPSYGKQTPNNDGILFRGFGITPTGEFKVILVIESFNISKRTWTLPAHLYSSSTNSWKRIDDAPQKPYLYSDNGHVPFFNGACHWLASHILLSFNTTTEVFGELELPYDLNYINGRGRHTYPIVVNDCLAVVRKDRYWLSGLLEVWVMKEYGIKESWTKQFVIQLQPTIAREMDIDHFLTWKNDEWLLFVIRHTRQLVRISLLTSEIEVLQISVARNMSPLIYEESLVSLN